MKPARNKGPTPLSGSPALRFLVVEPSEDGFIHTLDMLSEARGASYSVDWVTSLGAASRRIEDGHYDFILVEAALGRVPSLDLIRMAGESSRGVRTVLVSEHRDTDLASDARLAGASAYLVKSESGGAALERAIRAAALEDSRAVDAVPQPAGLAGPGADALL